MQVLQDGKVQGFPRHLVAAVSDVVRTRFREVVHGVSFDPHDNVMIGTTEGVIIGGGRELAGMFPDPVSALNDWLLVDEFEDPYESIAARLDVPVRQMRWDEVERRKPVRSWKETRRDRWEPVRY